MKYSYIANTKLRSILIAANKKRKFSVNSIKVPKGKNTFKKLPVFSQEIRKKHQSKAYSLQTYMEESKQRSKINAEGKMGALRGDEKKYKSQKK